MFYLCTIVQGMPERIKLIQMEKEHLEELTSYVDDDDDIRWIEDEDVVYGKSKM